MTVEHCDVVIIGAGLSGIGAAVHLARSMPGKSVMLLEARDATGGTWDLFRYPGVRSDSDMHTLGYAFRPWPGAQAFAGGPAILAYIRETAAAYDIDRHIRLGHKVVAASWSSRENRWTLDVEQGTTRSTVTCGFLFSCTGYYDYAGGYRPVFPGIDAYRGEVVHPQSWPNDLAVAGRRILVIGSGATAVTLVPALAARGAHVTMLQRSPSYVVALASQDPMAEALGRVLPWRFAQRLVRWRNILLSTAFYQLARRRPAQVKRQLLARVRHQVGSSLDVERHFRPSYDPWDQRLCVAPDADLFRVLASGQAEIVTDEIASFTESGVRLRSGRQLEAALVVTATGLTVQLLGGAKLSVDGVEADVSAAMAYKGSMFAGVPNFAYTLGYTNASWTLKSDLTARFVCRLLAYMDRHDYAAVVPQADAGIRPRPLIDFTSGYVQRALDRLPKQGDRWPWRLHQNYMLDWMQLRLWPIADGVLRFTPGQTRREASAPHVDKRSSMARHQDQSRPASRETSQSSLP